MRQTLSLPLAKTKCSHTFFVVAFFCVFMIDGVGFNSSTTMEFALGKSLHCTNHFAWTMLLKYNTKATGYK